MEKSVKKRLFVCCDGTWNRPTQREFGLLAPTNVVKFSNAVQHGWVSDAVEQQVYYHPGVGASDDFLDRVFGGAFGQGLGRNICSAYKWLCESYVDGDEIYVLGFSRGAFTARSLVGMVSHAGLIAQANWDQVKLAYKHYQNRKLKAEAVVAQTRFEQFRAQLVSSNAHIRPPIQFLGVWDTVGTMGIPQAGALERWLEKIAPYRSNRFHDLNLSSIVRCARHALGVDEQRQPFNASLWESEPSVTQSIEQVWFPGIHSDVGGGFLACGLSDGALRWMIDEAAKQGAVFDQNMLQQLSADRADNFQAPMHDTLTEIYNLVGARPRSLPALVGESELSKAAAYGQRAHATTFRRVANPPISDAPYRLTYVLQPGAGRSFPVYARSYWNAPGIFVCAGQRYAIQASGTWQDANLTRGPDGARATLLQWFFGWLRRVPEANWFSLIASIGSANSPNHSNDLTFFPTYAVGSQAIIEPQCDGYIYFFANDMTGMYGNNRGSVEVIVRRLPEEIPAHVASLPTAKILGRSEPDLWTFVARWIGSAAALAFCGYAALRGLTWLAAQWSILQGITSTAWWAWLQGALPVIMVSGLVFYMRFFGRSDTRVNFVVSKPL